jgi:3-hydroxybutyryl-CoA dehydratase
MGNNENTLPSVVKTITQGQLQEYAQASGDFNRLHLDAEFAASTQFGGIIAHGMLTLAFISEMMLSAFGPAWLESGTLKVRFKGAAYVGDQVETWGRITREEQHPLYRLLVCSIGVCRQQSGEEIISGTATVKLS